MTLDSVLFLSIFLPVVAGIYPIIPTETRKRHFLLAASLLFYSFGSVQSLIVLLLSSALNYYLSVIIRSGRHPKAICAAAVAGNLLLLGFYKYLDFLLAEILHLTQMQTDLIVPIGVSFFTFKAISYVVDVYRDPETGAKSFAEYLLYISFFPQITSGPISRFSDFQNQIPTPTMEGAAAGMRRFVIGLAKKCLLAATLAGTVDAIFSAQALDARAAWIGALAYSLQIYLDFSGYSDMAIGLGNLFGYQTKENFLYPYTADSLTDFWRRWHISLSSWFKDYLYIPLGGNRKGKSRAALNKAVVFTLCGLWHGANWTFLLWGAWHGLLSALESMKLIQPKKFLGRFYTLLVVSVGFVMFRASTVEQGMTILTAMVARWKWLPEVTLQLQQIIDPLTVTVIVAGVLACADWKQILFSGKNGSRWLEVIDVISYPVCIILFALCLLRLASGGFAPFIYAQF